MAVAFSLGLRWSRKRQWNHSLGTALFRHQTKKVDAKKWCRMVCNRARRVHSVERIPIADGEEECEDPRPSKPPIDRQA